MLLKRYLVASVAAAALFSAPASAATISDKDAALLLDRMKQLEQEVTNLRMQLSNVTAAQQVQTEQVAVAQQELTATKEQVKQVAAASNANSIKWKGAPEFKGEGGWSFKPRGRIQYDFASLSTSDDIKIPGNGFSNEARRVRLGAEGTIPGGFGYKLEADLLDNVVLTDAFMDYKSGDLTITVGQHNSFQSLEELSSSNDTSFIERAAFTDAFGFERKVGVSAEYKLGDFLVQAGVFTDNLQNLNENNDSIGFDGRLVYAPKIGDMQLHLGGSAHWRDLGDSIDSIRYRQRPLIHSVDVRFVNTGNIRNATDETRYGLEAAAISGRFHAMGEAQWSKVSRTGFADPTFFGGAIEAGFFLTDDKREYKGGVFKQVKVRKPVGGGGFGAVEFNVRYDRLDLVDSGIVGGTQDGYMASIIWNPVDYVRFMLNYAHIDYGNALGIVAGAPSDFSADVVGARAQFTF